MKYLAFLFYFTLSTNFYPPVSWVDKNQNYEKYHQQVIEIEQLITLEKYQAALFLLEELIQDYDFVFLREYQIATQLALFVKDVPKTKRYLEKGILAGWRIKSIKKNNFLKTLPKKDWTAIKKKYKQLNTQYKSTLNSTVRRQVKKMFSKDQWKALGALFTFSSDAQDRYAERKFSPHSEVQMARLANILETHGYPGERLIGNNLWMSAILNHHNSISQAYNEKDTLYLNLQPQLNQAIKNGQLSPYDFALMDDWYLLTKTSRTASFYGIVTAPKKVELPNTNELRKAIFLRSVETRNRLVDIQQKTGMDFYLPGEPWIDGKIVIE